MRIDRFVDHLRREVDEGLTGLGAQAAIVSAGELVLDYAYGCAGPSLAMSPDLLHNVRCATKPFLAVLLMRLHDLGAVCLTAPLAAHSSTDWALRDREATPLQLLSHSAGFTRPTLAEALLTPYARRFGTALTQRVENHVGYSEYAGWRLLAHLAEVTTGTAVEQLLLTELLEPAELDREAVFRADISEAQALSTRVGGYYTHLPASQRCSMHDQSLTALTGDLVECGGFISMRNLARFYDLVGQATRGVSTPGMPAPSTLRMCLDAARPRQWDAMLQRECAFAGGFMVMLQDHGFTEHLSASSIGHVGLMGTSFGLCDPERRLSLAVLLNGLNTSSDDCRAFYRACSSLAVKAFDGG